MAHINQQSILDNLSQATDVVVGSHYKHYKTGGIYVVEKLVMLEASDELAVAYHDQDFPDITWIRPYSDFTATVGGQRRFSLLS